MPLHFSVYMLELKGRSWTSRQNDDVFHQSCENSCTSRSRAQRPKRQNKGLLCRCSYRKKIKAVDNQTPRVCQLGADLLGKESILTAGCAISTGSSRKPVRGNCHMEGHNTVGWTVNLANACRWSVAISWPANNRMKMARCKFHMWKAAPQKREKKARTIRGRTNGKGWNCILSSESLFLLKASFINWELSWEITKYEKRMKNCRKLALLVTPVTTNIAWRDKCFANHSAAKMLPHEPQTETNVQCRGPWESRTSEMDRALNN